MSTSGRATLIRQARVFDGREVAGARDVLLRDGLIAQVGESIPAADHEIVEGGGRTLLPGLIDCHVHTWGDALVETLAFGVTTVVDLFTDVGFAAAMRQEQADGKASHRADLISAGNLATAPGGHGTQFPIPVATLDSAHEAEAFVKARVDEGSDLIKIIWEVGDGTWPTLDEATIQAVIESAHRHGKLAVIHVTRHRHARRAIEMGVDGLAHIFADPPDEDFGRLVAEAGAFVIPTLSVVASACGIASGEDLLDEEEFAAYLTPDQSASLRSPSSRTVRENYAHAQNAVRLLVKAGARVLAGTDARNPGTTCGASMHRELELLAECGMNPTQALVAATSAPAEVFGMPDRGVIREGKAADLLLVEGDPSTDLSATRRIVAIFKRGQRFDRAGFRDKVSAARAIAEVPAAKPPLWALDAGLISDFEAGLNVAFGAGWSVTTDGVIGGKSDAALAWVSGGADGSSGALRVEGETREGYLFPWAGAMFSPGSAPMAPADLSSREGISFRARGDGGEYAVAMMATSRGFRPVSAPLTLTEDWSEHSVSFEDIGLDGSDVTAIMFVCYEKRPFWLELDDVRLTGDS